MCQCDSCATGPNWQERSLASGSPNWDHATSQRVFEFAAEFERTSEAVQPKVMGRDLIAMGLKPGPGPEFKRLLSAALDLQDSDVTLSKEDILARILPVREPS